MEHNLQKYNVIQYNDGLNPLIYYFLSTHLRHYYINGTLVIGIIPIQLH